jgi:hypothetical protein
MASRHCVGLSVIILACVPRETTFAVEWARNVRRMDAACHVAVLLERVLISRKSTWERCVADGSWYLGLDDFPFNEISVMATITGLPVERISFVRLSRWTECGG